MTKTFTLKGGPLDGGKVELTPIFPHPLPALDPSLTSFNVGGEIVWYSVDDTCESDILYHCTLILQENK